MSATENKQSEDENKPINSRTLEISDIEALALGAWILGTGGSVVQSNMLGSFGIEAFALEKLITNLLYLCNNHGVTDNTWKIESTPYVQECLINVSRV